MNTAQEAERVPELCDLHTTLGLVAVNAEGRILDANAASVELLGTPLSPGDRLARYFALSAGMTDTDLTGCFADATPQSLAVRSPVEGCTLRVHLAGLCAGWRLVTLEPASSLPLDNAEARLAANDASMRDYLTGLGDRRLLDSILRDWQAQPAPDQPVAALVLDLDRFREVNDAQGHAAGDKLLTLVSARIKRCARGTDTLCSLGGDEFAFLQRGDPQPAAAYTLAERLVEILGRPFLIDGQQINIGASIGIALVDAENTGIDSLLQHANLALQEAKRQGCGPIQLFESRLATRAQARRELEAGLRRALSLNEFELLYQPRLSLSDDSVWGFEALLRWNSPSRGLVSPDDFLPLAEQIGIMVAVGDWVLHSACRTAAAWPAPLTVAVNLSPSQFADEQLGERIRSALEQSGLAPERLEIEISETGVIADADRAASRLEALSALGVGVVMDDFSTGYLSSGYIHRVPFSRIKIDRSFIVDRRDRRTEQLVSANLGLGQSLGIDTLAKGVETPEQLARLAHDGCECAQGFLIGKPMTATRIAAFLASVPNAPTTAEHHTGDC